MWKDGFKKLLLLKLPYEFYHTPLDSKRHERENAYELCRCRMILHEGSEVHSRTSSLWSSFP